ncbi:TPA: NUMOD4 motif-containing HNH endonuclease [Yersinia enterocolitica]|uniref:NUMOD4 motif-containing HNH endonuclease n=1 Tax=Yersinia enterocolitica TaxID=630 RepID=A0AAD2Z7X3_YEREN|nr:MULTISPECIES: NUMOD4 motif-containing HNH endonuclease [Yersinia]EKN3597042.1 NUMOD4 motif-containing HNH endonuclease [Yersinia enterocolitica]EKN3987247.1 NUMOD4 motif-containing HNH endonuclease [Yersinia enterocolitica]EKN4899768.1 NUMOD4 motif-containing HNH endonuclease [Yersinia enterocolitica]EKN5964985.1 endodeoxyribonuclease [Yersinia enterocolitica]EKN6107292.1 endodeoxyribonuclease [Yersinia enterocolitica]
MLSETAKDIAGYEGHYAVTADGRIYSHSRVNALGGLTKGRWLRPGKGGRGYLVVNLCSGGVTKTHSLHRLVAKAYIPNPERAAEVNHINGDKTDNRVENLEWVTSSENKAHAYKYGLYKTGEGHSRAKLTDADILSICSSEEFSPQELAVIYGVDRSYISYLRRGKGRCLTTASV